MTSTIRLTSRETDVLRLLARGCSYSQVGDRLGISLHTVTSHIKNAYRKLEAHSARAAVWRAMELQLLGELVATVTPPLKRH
jgi:DNA-binding CsgD family transcriptional regulator